jgi:hypothetical protein
LESCISALILESICDGGRRHRVRASWCCCCPQGRSCQKICTRITI